MTELSSSLEAVPARAVIMDWDGVIADSLPTFVGIYQTVCRHFGRGTPPTRLEDFRRWYKPRWEQNYLDLGYREDELPAVLAWATTIVPSYADIPLFAPVVAAIRRLAEAGVPLAIASTTDSRIIGDRLETVGLRAAFRIVVGGEDGGSEKITRYRRAADGLGIDPRLAVGVGDTSLDVESARHWGMHTIGVTYGWSDPALIAAARPDRVVDDPRALEAALCAILGLPCEVRSGCSAGHVGRAEGA